MLSSSCTLHLHIFLKFSVHIVGQIRSRQDEVESETNDQSTNKRLVESAFAEQPHLTTGTKNKLPFGKLTHFFDVAYGRFLTVSCTTSRPPQVPSINLGAIFRQNRESA